jgi:23S rRNA (uracil1939-C5)-methyltransferase/tRNA (uracil-5-)-methyltransferase
MDAINQALPEIRADLHQRARTFRRGSTVLIRASEEGVTTDFKTAVTERVSGLSFRFLAGDFFQNNPFILSMFTAYVADRAAEGGARFLVDAYCGSGLFALTLAARFEKVAGVEVSETSCEWARCNARDNGIDHAEFLTASAEAIFDAVEFPAPATTVVIDPPRKGCTPEFIEQLAAYGPSRLVYVSCDPATQVRDLRLLMGCGFRLCDVQPFDLFPHTRHVECVMTLHRAARISRAFAPPIVNNLRATQVGATMIVMKITDDQRLSSLPQMPSGTDRCAVRLRIAPFARMHSTTFSHGHPNCHAL